MKKFWFCACLVVCLIAGLACGMYARIGFGPVDNVSISGDAAPGGVCTDGTPADKNGCCQGEVYTDMDDLGFNCCPVGGGNCFPPIR